MRARQLVVARAVDRHRALVNALILVGASVLVAYFVSRSPTNLDEGDIWVLLSFFGGLFLLIGIVAALLLALGAGKEPRRTRLWMGVSAAAASAIFAFSVVTHVLEAIQVEGAKAAFAGF